MMQKVIKAGNSKAVTIPAEFSRMVGVSVGDMVKSASLPERGQVVYTFSGVRQLSINQQVVQKGK